jgi:hypothetical protein
MCRPLACITLVVFTSLISVGCTTDSATSVRKFLGWDDSKSPSMPKYPTATVQVAERVENLGVKIVSMTPSIELDTTKIFFSTIGIPESALFHRGPEHLFISEGLVNKCKSEEELAAVLCTELGQMVADKRAAKKAGAERDAAIPDVALPGGSQVMTGGGTPADTGRMAEIGFEQRRPKTPVYDPIDGMKQARILMRNAGYDIALLDQVQPLIKESDRGALVRKQMSGSAPAPKWDAPPQ